MTKGQNLYSNWSKMIFKKCRTIGLLNYSSYGAVEVGIYFLLLTFYMRSLNLPFTVLGIVMIVIGIVAATAKGKDAVVT
jgi:hypothetical protein